MYRGDDRRRQCAREREEVTAKVQRSHTLRLGLHSGKSWPQGLSSRPQHPHLSSLLPFPPLAPPTPSPPLTLTRVTFHSYRLADLVSCALCPCTVRLILLFFILTPGSLGSLCHVSCMWLLACLSAAYVCQPTVRPPPSSLPPSLVKPHPPQPCGKGVTEQH